MPRKSTKKPRQAVNQFIHTNKSAKTPEKDMKTNSGEDIEIKSLQYPKENGVFTVRVQDERNVSVELQITSHLHSVVFNRCVKNTKDLPVFSTEIKPGESINYPVQIKINGRDHVYMYLYFHFLIGETGQEITKKIIIRSQKVTPDIDLLQPTSPYKPPPAAVLQKGQSAIIDIYPAPRLEIPQTNNLPKFKLDQYLVSDHIRNLVNRGLLESTQEQQILEAGLNRKNYKKIFELLLNFEEMQAEINLARFKIEKTPMYFVANSIEGIYLDLEIAGIIDNDARVEKYGKLGVRIYKDETLEPHLYEGNIEDKKTTSISLHFGKELAKIYHDEMLFQVQFIPCRFNIRNQHRALNLVENYSLWSVLFPSNENIGQLGTEPLQVKEFFDKNIGKNPEQGTAVRNIVSGISRPCPYIVFGPPGTGKTVTIIEAMKQIITLSPGSRILACAFSNAAADILVKKLINFKPEIKLLRMYALYIEPEKLPKDIKQYSNFEKNKPFFPNKEELKNYDIIITTVMTAGRLGSNQLKGCFSHIFIDECGFCMEPEVIVAFAGILDITKTQLILAGDPKQLGPIVTSPLAQKYKLDVSLLERLMTTMPIYQRQSNSKYDQRVITKLLKNYRSHPVILKVVNDLFYDEELQVGADMQTVSQFCKWETLPKKNFPLLMHSVVGQEQREGKSPSYFNTEEANVVVDYIMQLKQSYRISPSEIGVITPYCKQVQKINILLQKKQIKGIKVNSVEKFLGDERMVIIISTVRSNPGDTEDVYKSSLLGFLTNRKRFNVAVSRPKALLIVIGNAKPLYNDPNWASLISYCAENNAIKAESLPAMEDLTDFFKSMKIEKS